MKIAAIVVASFMFCVVAVVVVGMVLYLTPGPMQAKGNMTNQDSGAPVDLAIH